MRRNLEGYRRTGAQIVQGRVNIVHDGLQAPLSPEIRRSQDMRKVIVGMARVQGRDQVCEGAST